MRFAFKLDHLIWRVALVTVTSAVCGALVWLIHTHFILRFVTDPRLSLNREVLAAAANRFPDSSRVYLRLAQAEIQKSGAGQEESVASAISHLQRAADLSNRDYKARYLLGLLEEVNGDSERAEESLRAAAALAPHHTEVNWALANLLLRRGEFAAALDPFRQATKNNEDLLPLAFDLLWQSSGGALDPLKELAGADASAQLSLVQFLLEKSLSSEALNIFHGIDRDSKLNSLKSATFIRSLIGAGQFEQARALWLDLMTGSAGASPSPPGLIWNGGFESDSVRDLDHFDWTVTPNEYARIGIDTGMAHGGTRSLKIVFAGRDTTVLNGQIKQLVVLQPGKRYRLECYAKARELVTPEGPRIAILGSNGVIATSKPVAEGGTDGTTDWQHLVVEFIAPDDHSARFIGIVRIPKFSYDEPTRGAVWFDDFTLTEF